MGTKLPVSWHSVLLSDVAEVVTGKTPSTKNLDNFGGNIPFIKPADLDSSGYITQTIDTLTELGASEVPIIPKNSIAVTCIGNLGKVGITTQRSATNQQINSVLPSSMVGYQFLYYQLQTLKPWMQENASATTVTIINKGKFSKAPIILVPIAEQKAIADKLDTLLAQVENTKARLERIPQILKRFRQSVLAAAVSGRLTEEWREKNSHICKPNLSEIKEYWSDIYRLAGKRSPAPPAVETSTLGKTPDCWIEASMSQVFDVFVGSTPSRSREDYWNGEIQWVSSSEVAFCRIKSTKEKITEIGLSSASTTVHPAGTVMLAMIGQGKTRGQVAILDIPACHNQNTAALRVPEGFVVSSYLYYYLVQQYDETRRIGGGNNQKALNKRVIQAMRFPMPPFKEQIEIVGRVDQLFTHANRIEQQVNQALARVNNLTQSILAKAFRGELTEQWRKDNPELISGENSAEALLERIKKERAAKAPAKRTRKKATV